MKNENEKGSRNELWIKNEFENESCFPKPNVLKSFQKMKVKKGVEMLADIILSIVFTIIAAVAMWIKQDDIDEWRKEL